MLVGPSGEGAYSGGDHRLAVPAVQSRHSRASLRQQGRGGLKANHATVVRGNTNRATWPIALQINDLLHRQVSQQQTELVRSPISEPSPITEHPAATRAPSPPEEPPGVRVGS
jgi:hypothetical protein